MLKDAACQRSVLHGMLLPRLEWAVCINYINNYARSLQE
uniref:Rho-GAP domain-containing protein n=1 Tax=Steinernema glaseri TaxID=37863 RepID=A0A1I8A2V9_9BILA